MTAHTLNLLLKDIGKMNFVQPTLVDANHIVKLIHEHQFTYALFCTLRVISVYKYFVPHDLRQHIMCLKD